MRPGRLPPVRSPETRFGGLMQHHANRQLLWIAGLACLVLMGVVAYCGYGIYENLGLISILQRLIDENPSDYPSINRTIAHWRKDNLIKILTLIGSLVAVAVVIFFTGKKVGRNPSHS